jgi:hypothetical protein
LLKVFRKHQDGRLEARQSCSLSKTTESNQLETSIFDMNTDSKPQVCDQKYQRMITLNTQNQTKSAFHHSHRSFPLDLPNLLIMSNKNGKQIAKKLILKQYVTQYH